MKPYEFYQRRIYKDHKLDPKEVRKWSFYDGRSSEYGVDLRELGKPTTSSEPTHQNIFIEQRKTLMYLIYKLQNNNPEFNDLYKFISQQSTKIQEKYNKENSPSLMALKSTIKSVNDVVKDIESQKGHSEEIKNMIKKINKATSDKDRQDAINLLNQKDESYIKEFLKRNKITRNNVQQWVNKIKVQYINLIKAIDSIYEEIHSKIEYGSGAVTTINWEVWKQNKEKLEKELEEIKTWNLMGKDGEELDKMYKKILSRQNLNECNDLIHHVSNYVSGKAGEYITYYFIKKAIAEGELIGHKYLGIINTGGMRIAGAKHELRFDHVVVTSQNANVKIKYSKYIETENGKKKQETVTKSLLELCNELDKNFNEKDYFGKYEIVIENLDDLIQKNVFDGYTIQSKFRNDPNSITNDPKYSINELVQEGLASTDLMTKYARQLDLFVEWYKRSQKYHTDKGEGTRSWVYASYTPGSGEDTPLTDTNSTDLYERYFNYLLSREEVIEKVYGASVFMFITTNGVTSLQSYLSQKLTRDINPQSAKGYSLLSAGSIVDISKSDRKIRISINSNLHSYADKYKK